MLDLISQQKSLLIKQRKELAEVFGFETRNKYEILTADGKSIGFAAEQKRGIFGALLRQIFGHWRSFDIKIFDTERKEKYNAHHPFRFYFQRLDITGSQGEKLGYIEKEFSIFSKKFSIFNKAGRNAGEMYAGLFKIWNYPIKKDGMEIANIKKKWGGVAKEIFLDADTFLLEFQSQNIPPEEKILLLMSALFIDILYFENNQQRGFSPLDLISGS